MVDGEINFETDFSTKIYSGLSLTLKSGQYHVADTPGAVPANDVAMHAAASDILTGVEDIPLSVQTLSELFSQDHIDVVLPLVDSGLYNGLDKPFEVKRFVRIQTFSPTLINVRPTNPKRIEALKKHIADDSNRKKLVEEEHKASDNMNNYNRRMGRTAPVPNAASGTTSNTESIDEQKQKSDEKRQLEKENEEWEKYKLKEKVEEASEKKEEVKKKRNVEMQNEQIKKNEDRDKKQLEQTKKARLKAEKRKKEKANEQKFKKLRSVEKPGYDYFDVKFDKKGPLGLWFTPNKYPPTIDRSQGRRNQLRMVTGDTLIAVNKELIETKGKLSDAIVLISKAKWPKILRFERKKRNAEEKQVKIGAGNLNVVWPRILQDQYPILRAQFSTHFPCGIHNISVAEPFEACKDISNTPMLQKGGIILVGRGMCTFSTKAYTGQDAGGDSVLMVNTEQKLLDMPAGNGKVDDLNTPMFSIGALDGATIKVASRLLKGLSKFIVAKYDHPKDIGKTDANADKNGTDCTSDDYATKYLEIKQQQFYQDDFGAHINKLWEIKYQSSKDSVYGNLLLWDGEITKAFKIQFANFGSPFFPETAFVFTMSTPFDACRGIKSPIKNAVVAIQRGKCQMLDKAKLAQGAGSLGLIIVNTEPKVVSPYADPKEAAKITIPVAMVSSEAKDFILESTRNGKRRVIGKVIISVEEL